MNIIPLPALQDNYIWVAHDGEQAIVVDPSEAEPVERFLSAQGLRLAAILITHHHHDHVGGIKTLLARHPAPVYGPANEQIAGVDHPVSEGDVVNVSGLTKQGFRVLDVPGHTAGHIAYFGEGALFSGDTLFSGGCGRVFEGTPQQMFASLAKLAALPPETNVYCAHEYTLSNLKFARMVEPDNVDRDHYAAHCEALRAQNEPTLPSSIAVERDINPFLRAAQPSIVAAVTKHFDIEPEDETACFALLREWKNSA